jgi:hypothetical protein
MISASYRWSIYRILQFPEAAKTPLWTKIDALQTDLVWSAEVLRIVDLLVAGQSNPNALFGSTAAYQPGLKKADVLEWFEGLSQQEASKTYDKLWQDLAIMIGKSEIISALPVAVGAVGSTGLGFGFS